MKKGIEIKIPYNIFIFLWCLAGIFITVYSFFREDHIEFNGKLLHDLLWLLVFILYSYNFIKAKVFKNK